jgi:membrane-associated phospholipid phosphatase
MRKIFILLLSFLCCQPGVKGQGMGFRDSIKHVYKVNYFVSGAFCLVATAADIYAIPKVIKAKQDLTEKELDAINPNALSAFDRMALNEDPAKRDDYYKVSDYGLPLIVASAGALVFDKKIKRDWFRILVMYYETHAVAFSIYNYSFLGPAFQNKLRPIVYYDDYYTRDERRGGNQRNSMYSGHTASAAASTFFMVKVYCDYHPDISSARKHILYGLAVVPPIIEGYFRMKALAHFPSDIMIGVGVGALCGVTVPSLHRIREKKPISLSMIGTPVGPGLGLNWTIEGMNEKWRRVSGL